MNAPEPLTVAGLLEYITKLERKLAMACGPTSELALGWPGAPREGWLDGRNPTANAARKCADWLRWCRENGWPASSTGKLADLWWEFHDDNGELIPGSQSDAAAERPK